MGKMNAAYLRVSTEAQTEKYGLDVQKQKILDYCQKNNVLIDKWYIDGGYSGSKLDRPEIQKLLADAECGQIGTVFVYKLDRLSRDTVDTLNLLNKTLPGYGVRVVSMTEDIKTDNPMDKLIVTVNAGVNQYEREVIRMRMSAGMVERVKKGLWMGGGRVPHGYYYDRNDGILHPKEDEAELVRKAYKLYLEGYSCDKIARILGFKGERIVIESLKRKSNIGLIEYKGKVYQGKHEPIVDEKTFFEVQEMMKKRSTNAYINNDNMLTGLCYCGVCGARMRYMKWGSYHKIVCYSQYAGKDYMKRDPNCDNKNPVASDVEAEVEEWIREFIFTVEKGEERKSNVALLESEIAKTNTKIKKMYETYFENESENIMELIKEAEGRVKDLKKQLAEEQQAQRKADSESLDKIKESASHWDTMTNRQKNKLLKCIIEKIVITGDKYEIFFAPL